MITAIAVNNMHGISRSLAVGRLTLLTGPNGAGKSTMLEGVDFALKGTIPGQSGKDNELFAACSTGEEMMAGVTIGGRGAVNRYLVRDKKGTVSHQGHIGDANMLKKPPLNAVIEQAVPLSVVSLAGFWALSENKQIADLARYYTGEEYSQEKIRGQFAAAFLPKSDAPTQFELLALIQDRVKTKKSEYTATIAGAENTIKTLSAQKDAIERPAGNLADIETEIASLRQTASQIRANLEKFGRDKANKEAWDREKKEADEALAGLKSVVGPDGNPELKSSKIYEWEMNRCRDEKAKSKVTADQQLVDFAKKILAGMETAGCDACPVMILPKQTIKASTPKTVDLVALEAEFKRYQELHKKALEAERLEIKLTTLSNDPRKNIDLSTEHAQASDSISARIDELTNQKELLSNLATIETSIEATRTGKVEAEEKLVETKKAEASIKKIRAGMMAEIFGPVTAAVNRFLPSGEAVVSATDDGHLFVGWQIEGRSLPTPHCSLSGGEKAQFDPAMGLGLLSLEGEGKDKLLLIEAAEMTRTSLRQFCATLAGADDNVQVIVATHTDGEAPLAAIEGWDVVELGYHRGVPA